MPEKLTWPKTMFENLAFAPAAVPEWLVVRRQVEPPEVWEKKSAGWARITRGSQLDAHSGRILVDSFYTLMSLGAIRRIFTHFSVQELPFVEITVAPLDDWEAALKTARRKGANIPVEHVKDPKKYEKAVRLQIQSQLGPADDSSYEPFEPFYWAPILYKNRDRFDDLRRALKLFTILHEGSPVWRYDLRTGEAVKLVTLYDLVSEPEEMVVQTRRGEKRELYMLSERQWENAEYPSEAVGGPPKAAEASDRVGSMRAGEARREATKRRRAADLGEAPRGDVDEQAADELRLYADNESRLYGRKQAIRKNLRRKQLKGTYKESLAAKLWLYWVDDAAKRYAKEFGSEGGRDWAKMFNKATREHVAAELAADEGERLKSGEFDKELGLKAGESAGEAREAKENPKGRAPKMAPIEIRNEVIAGLLPYGASLNDTNNITRGEKILSVALDIRAAQNRFAFVSNAGDTLASYPTSNIRAGVSDFVEKFWFWKPKSGGEVHEADEARGFEEDYPNVEAALLGAQSKFDATHAIRNRNLTIFSPSSKGYVKRVGFQEKGFYHWPEKGEVVGDLPAGAVMIHKLIDSGWDPDADVEVRRREGPPMRRAAEADPRRDWSEEAHEASKPLPKWGPEADKAIEDAIALFPETFELHNHRGTFRISRSASYVNDYGQVMLYTQKLHTPQSYRELYGKPHRTDDDLWVDFAKGSIDELHRNLVKFPKARENPVDVSDGTVPWVKISRDPEQYKAAMAVADKIGPIDDCKKIYKLLAPTLLKEDQETFLVVLLDVRQQCRGVAEVHRGGRSRVAVDHVDVLRVVLTSGAEGFIVCHNHPTGKTSPSPADRDLTESIKKAAELFDEITFVDHVILGNDQCYSFADRKLHKFKAKK